jgi:alanine racemase
MAVVKANAYGHGIVGIAEAAVAGGARCFGVACVDEGAQLRSAGIDCPILVLGYVPHWEAARVMELDLGVALASQQLALALSRAAASLGRAATVHVKVDTGMGRFGVLPEETCAFMQFCRETPGLRVEGIFTHLATAEDADTAHARSQLDRFDDVCRALGRQGVLPPQRHALNSAGAVQFPDHHHDLVRCGISVYGVPAGDLAGLPALRPALSLRARVARLRRLPTGACVGYGCAFRALRPTDVALLPIGYADGVSRSLGGVGSVLVGGRRAALIGRVSMDQATVDVTGLDPVRQDDEVVLLGRQGDDEITADEVAAWRGTVGYEVLTGLSIRVPRVYTRGGAPIAVCENGEYRRLLG